MSGVSRTLAFLVACLILTSCAPQRPSGVPKEAEAAWSLKGDWTWTWKRALSSGCVAWMAKDSWASVQLVVDSNCEDKRGDGYLDGRGISYFSFQDYLVFRACWPWTPQDWSDLIVFDDEGMISNILECPHVLSKEHIIELRLIAAQALAKATTDAEKRLLARIDQRLAATDGGALSSGQAGCRSSRDKSSDSQDLWTLR